MHQLQSHWHGRVIIVLKPPTKITNMWFKTVTLKTEKIYCSQFNKQVWEQYKNLGHLNNAVIFQAQNYFLGYFVKKIVCDLLIPTG